MPDRSDYDFKKFLSSAKFLKLCRLLSELGGIDLVLMTPDTTRRSYVGSIPKEAAPLCAFMRQNPSFNSECRRCDSRNCEAALLEGAGRLYKCHAGLIDIIIPIIISGRHAGSLIGGELFDTPASEGAFREFRRRLSAYKFDEERLREHFFEAPRMDQRRIRNIVELAGLFAEHLDETEMLQESHAGEGLVEQALSFVRREFRRPIGLEDLAKALGTTPQYASALLSAKTGEGFCLHLRRQRLERAKRLLESSSYDMGRVAAESGFASIRSFNRAFKESEGLAPRLWRKAKRQESLKLRHAP